MSIKVSLEKLKILTPLQKLPKNVGDLDKLIVATGFKSCPKCKKSPNLVTLVPANTFLNQFRRNQPLPNKLIVKKPPGTKNKGGSIDQDATEVGLANPLALCNYLQRQTLELMSNKF